MWQLNTTWKTQINILWFGQVILMAMLAMSLPYWPLYIAKLGQFSPQEIRFWSAAIYAAPFVTSIICAPLWGRLGDRHGYKPMVIRACLGLFITHTLILCFASVYWIFLFRLLQGVLAGFIVTAQAWALAISPDEQRGATIGKLQSATAIGTLAGPLMGGIIATVGGYQAIFSSSSIICAIVTIVFFCCLQNTPKANKDIAVTEKKDRKKNTLFSRLQQQALSILLIIIIIQLARQIITPVFALFVTEQLHGNDISVGILYAAPGLMVFFTASYWGKYFDKVISAGHQVYNSIATLLFISAVIQVLHAYANTLISVCILRLLWGICLGALMPVLLRLLLDNNADEKGLFLGFGNSATKFGNLIGVLLGATVELYFGYVNTFLMTAMLYLIAVGVILYLKPVKSIAEA
ncbi:rhizoferrin export MFS transporter FslB [soil metagenome]